MKRTSASLALSVLMLGILFVCVLLAAVRAPVRADGPEQQPAIPRHRVGHRAKTQDLDTLLAQGKDPLAGNYKLMADDEILVLALHSDNPLVVRQAYDVDAKLDAPTLMSSALDSGKLPAVATGNFAGKDQDDFVALWTDSELNIYMGIGHLDGTKDDTYIFPTLQSVHHANYHPCVATGDFDGDAQDEIVMAWVGGGNMANLRVYDPQGVLNAEPVAGKKLYDVKLNYENLDVATGDFDGDGKDEVVLAWIDTSERTAVMLYDVDGNGTLTPGAKARSTWVGNQLGVATGDFDADAIDEIATYDGVMVMLLQAGAYVTESLTITDEADMYCDYSNTEYPIPNQIAAGDLNADGGDEIVTLCFGGGASRELQVWTSTSKLELHRKAYTSYVDVGGYTGAGSLSIGDLNRDLRREIVEAWAVVDGTQQRNYLKIHQVSQDLEHIWPKGQQDLGTAPRGGGLALAVGDLDGDSLRVGPPVYSIVSEAKQLLATINEPPKHYDIIDGSTFDVNRNPNTYARYENDQKQSTQMTLSTTRDWAVSDALEVEKGGINLSLKNSYGQNFELTTSTFMSKSFGTNVWASMDDVLIRTETDFDVWEYPVYSGTNPPVLKGHLMVVFPRKLNPRCKENCDTSVVARIDGTDPLSLYYPNHENHNLLSYSSDPPGDIGTTIKSNIRDYVGTNPAEFWVSWSDVKENAAKISRQLEVSVGAGVEGWGIKVGVEGTYKTDKVTTQQVRFESDTSIHAYFDSINGTYRYTVDPWIYWSKHRGHLVLDYEATPETPDPPIFWGQYYATNPDPAMSLPWKYDPPGPAYRRMTKEISFDPHSPSAGNTVTVTARVHNYSLLNVDNVEVAFYVGDPGTEDRQKIGSTQTIPTLQARSTQTVTVQLEDTSDFGGQTLDVYAVIDPRNRIAEIHDETNLPDNNTAYAQLPVTLPKAPAPRPTNLSISAEDIDVRPEAPTTGETVHISATVRAEGDAFTYVGVEFWDGNPRQGGEYIRGERIPMILVGESGTAHVTWDTTGKLGEHDIWVNVDYLGVDEDVYADNWTHVRIELAPYRQYLPLAYKES